MVAKEVLYKARALKQILREHKSRIRLISLFFDTLEEKEIKFKALNPPMDTTTPAGRVFLQTQAAFAEMERNIIRQRINEGSKAARARGGLGGRKRVMSIDKLKYAQHLMTDRNRTMPGICKELGNMPSSPLDHYLHADGSLKEAGKRLLQIIKED